MDTALPVLLPDCPPQDIAVIGSRKRLPPELRTRGRSQPWARRKPPAAVIWCLEARSTVTSTAEDLATRCLDHGGSVLLLLRSPPFRRPKSSDIPLVLREKRNVTCNRWLFEGSRLVRPDYLTAASLPDTSKATLVRRLLRKLAPLSEFVRRRTTEWEVVAVTSGSRPGPLWIEELMSVAERDIGVSLAMDDFRWIDRTEMDVAITKVAPGSGGLFAVETALDDAAERRLSRQVRNIRRLESTRHVPSDLRSTLPSVLGTGTVRNRRYLLTEWVNGQPGSLLMYSPLRRRAAVDDSIRWVTRLHKESIGPELDPTETSTWSERVLLQMGAKTGERNQDFASNIRHYLKTSLTRASLPSVLGHGDYWLGNIVFDPATMEVRSVFDWDQADFRAPPLEDVLHMLFFQKGILTRYRPMRHLGALLTGRESKRTRRQISIYWSKLGLDPDVFGSAVLLYWIRFLERREEQFPRSADWYEENQLSVRNVLRGRTAELLDGLGSRVLNRSNA